MEKIIIASSNAGKINEIRNILPEFEFLGLSDIGFTEEIEEDGESFEQNALIKARVIHNACSCTVIADDSGLCVDALNGAPGVLSARFSGVHGDDRKNNEKLLECMSGTAAEKRTARFICAAAAVFSDGEEYTAEGRAEGFIAFEESGENGFGYDPLFISRETGISFAQMSEEQKNMISHRKKAFAALAKTIKNKLQEPGSEQP